MSKRGLTKETVLDAAEALVEQVGADRLTTGMLAEKLGIKPASLYNHMDSTDSLRAALAERAIRALSKELSAAVNGRSREDAFFSLANAYRAFAHRSPGMYHLILRVPMSGNDEVTTALPEIVHPVLRLFHDFDLSDTERTHFQRVLRTVMHGFSTQELCGFFNHSDESRDDTYRLAIRLVLNGILAAEATHRSNTETRKDTIS